MVQTKIEQTLRDIIGKSIDNFDASLLESDTEFLESGMDSLDMATFFLAVQEMFNVVLEPDEEHEYDTLTKLTRYVSENVR